MNTPQVIRPARTAGTASDGFTLLELMITVTILSFVWLGIGSLVSNQTSTSLENQDEVETSAAVQAAANIINNDIIMSGFGSADASDAFAHVNVAGATAGSDTLTLSSAAQPGEALASFVIAGSIGVSGSEVWVRCYGPTSWGGRTEPTRDVAFDKTAAALTPPIRLWISFFSPFDMKRLTHTPTWTEVIDSDPLLGGDCIPNTAGLDANNDGIADPGVKLTIDPPLGTPVGTGTIVYAMRSDAAGTPTSLVTYAVTGTGTTGVLTRNGESILAGIDDFQVQYMKRNGGGVWLNDLTGVSSNEIEQIRYAFVVRLQRASMRPFPIPTFTVLDHTYTVPDTLYERKLFTFNVRPKNNGLIEVQ